MAIIVDWMQLSIGSAAMATLYMKFKADTKILSDELDARKGQQEQLIKAIIEKDDKQNFEIGRLVDGISKLLEKNEQIIATISAANVTLTKIIVSDSHSHAYIKEVLIEVKQSIVTASEKFDTSLSKMHNRLDILSGDCQVIKNNTNIRLMGVPHEGNDNSRT